MGMSKSQIVEKLTSLGIPFDAEAKVADLVLLLPKEAPLSEQLRQKIIKDFSKPTDYNLQRNMRIALQKLTDLENSILACEKVKKLIK